MNFYDRYHYENAAYELGKLLGVTNIPPVVMRIIDGEKGCQLKDIKKGEKIARSL